MIAGYSSQKGQGYHVQLSETCPIPDAPNTADQETTKTQEAKPARLITGVKTEGANEPDSKALIPMLEKTEENELAPSLLLADTAYGSDENVQAALNSHGVEVISPASGKDPEGEIKLSDFHTNESGEIISCPGNYKLLRFMKFFLDKTACFL